MMMETVCFSETLASTDESTWRQNPEKQHHPHPREDIVKRLMAKICLTKQLILTVLAKVGLLQIVSHQMKFLVDSIQGKG
jgi:hypothetical protein